MKLATCHLDEDDLLRLIAAAVHNHDFLAVSQFALLLHLMQHPPFLTDIHLQLLHSQPSASKPEPSTPARGQDSPDVIPPDAPGSQRPKGKS